MNIVDQIALRASAERPAIVFDGGTWSYGELLERVSEAAGWLERCPDFHRASIPRVGLSCPSGPDYIVLALAILKAGGCLVPLAEELTEHERAEIVERTGLHGILAAGGEMPVWAPVSSPAIEDEAAFAALDPAFIRFSSGTTGRSKGVILSHRGLRERIVAANAGLGIGPSDRVLWMLPMAHHFAVSIVLYLYHGACTVLGCSHLAEDVLRLAESSRATVIYGSPFHHALLAADGGNFRWPELRLAVSTAAPLPPATAEAFRARFDKPLVQGLGIIEIGLPLLNVGCASEAPSAVGRPLPAFDVELRDEEGRAVPPGNIGELWIKGPGMFDAYLSPWQTLEEICVDGWFATGDLAETDAAGRVYLRGRKKSVLNIGGMKVFPEEIEAVLDRHPAVKRSCVTGHEHRTLGTVPVADVVLRTTANPRELIAWCRESLSAFKVPARIRVVDSVPLTASGKIRRG